MRLFFALPLPADAKERLRPSLETARKAGSEGVGFTRISQIHFTLAFLGEQKSADAALTAGEVLRDNEAFELAIGRRGRLSQQRPAAGAVVGSHRGRGAIGGRRGAAAALAAVGRLHRGGAPLPS